ncbi:uncharacterized protein LOC111710748 isoform X2 [Eurytemora carolleeae]|uniref:uncharacterized protein LOC111710748 isoform X2 n=1 Tax=Eurytemora carolleeae TaxID=1294199 RepID=UPI000C77CCE4|nr:uncharacterized protein LOC111710748 isoform X2 [Eurytemora carolleeae]|eukprot:XP_023340636.1 uncharacterized protein LOC111710748 isoform X2 [Eurytemora affinis]
MKMSSTDVEEKISNKDFAVEGEEGHDAGKGEEEVVAGGKVEDDLDGGGQVDEVEDEGEEESRVFIQNITATVLSAHRFGIYISFVHEENSEIGVLFPGKSFVNGTLLLGDAVRTDQELSLLFPVGLKVYADMVSQVPRLVPESGSSPSFRDDKGEEKKCCWVINCLWVGDLDCKPDKNSLNDGTLFRAEDSSFK